MAWQQILIETAMLGYYICLLYKLSTVGIGLLVVMIMAGSMITFRSFYLLKTLPLLCFSYLFLSTATAFLYSGSEGAYRSIQFLVIALASLACHNYFTVFGETRRRPFLNLLFLLTGLIFLHMVVYHFMTGRIVTWKYLYDTKTVLCLLPLFVFAFEDKIREHGGAGIWYISIAMLAVLVFMSGERKAYVLLVLLFLISRTPAVYKMAIGLFGVIAISAFVAVAPPDDYLAGQVRSLFEEEQEMHISEYYLIESISDQSDIIRDFVNRMAREQFAEHPIIGLGAGGYHNWSKNTFGTGSGSQGLTLNVHGEVNRVPAEGGIIGIVISLSLLVVLAAAVYSRFVRNGKWHGSSMGRFPVYFFAFLVIYVWYEALDTLLLSMVVMFGLEMSRPARRSPQLGEWPDPTMGIDPRRGDAAGYGPASSEPPLRM